MQSSYSRIIQQLWRFLGSVWMAIIVITLLLVTIASATFVESYFHSHEAAEYYIYHTPWFRLLLVLLFVNILISALLRYPFKGRHVGFLLTHLGLLLLIGGVIGKNYYGEQGHLFLWEGQAKDSFSIAHTLALKVEQGTVSTITALKRVEEQWVMEEVPIFFTTCQVTGCAPHGKRGYIQPSLKESLSESPQELWLVNGGYGGYITYRDDKEIPVTVIAERATEEIPTSWEERTPWVRFKARYGLDAQEFALLFDARGGVSPTAIFNGRLLTYLIEEESFLPFSIWLHRAETQYYPQTDQPESYRAELILLRPEGSEPIALSMNRPFETLEGYRLYLSHVEGKADEVKGVRLSISRDPYKYTMTYPGIGITLLGVVLLLFRKPRK